MKADTYELMDYEFFVASGERVEENIYKFCDGSYRYYDEASIVSDGYTSIAAARIYEIEYFDWLHTGRVLICE